MDFKVNEETLKGTTRCPFGFACLRDPAAQVCSVQRAIAGDGVFVESRREDVCPYMIAFGYGRVCTCATRIELYERYNV